MNKFLIIIVALIVLSTSSYAALYTSTCWDLVSGRVCYNGTSGTNKLQGIKIDASDVLNLSNLLSASINYTPIQNFSSNVCPAGNYAYSRLQNGTWLCRADVSAAGTYNPDNTTLINEGGIDKVNMSLINYTIDARENDTLYTAGENISIVSEVVKWIGGSWVTNNFFSRTLIDLMLGDINDTIDTKMSVIDSDVNDATQNNTHMSVIDSDVNDAIQNQTITDLEGRLDGVNNSLEKEKLDSGNNYTALIARDNAINDSTNINDLFSEDITLDTNFSTACNDGFYGDGDGNCYDFNISVKEVTKVITYNASTINTTRGTHTLGNISSIQSDNTDYYNVTELSGANPLIIIINFTDVGEFNQIVMSLDYMASSTHNIKIGLEKCSDGTYEESFFPDISGMDTFAHIIRNVVASSTFNCGGNVSLRLRHVENGQSSHILSLNHVILQKGSSAVAEEVDPLALHKSGDNHMEGDLDLDGNNLINSNNTPTNDNLADNITQTEIDLRNNIDTNATKLQSDSDINDGSQNASINLKIAITDSDANDASQNSTINDVRDSVGNNATKLQSDSDINDGSQNASINLKIAITDSDANDASQNATILTFNETILTLNQYNSTQFEEDTEGKLTIKTNWFGTIWDAIFGTKTTDDLTEGVSNLYDNSSFNESHTSTLYPTIVNVRAENLAQNNSLIALNDSNYVIFVTDINNNLLNADQNNSLVALNDSNYLVFETIANVNLKISITSSNINDASINSSVVLQNLAQNNTHMTIVDSDLNDASINSSVVLQNLAQNNTHMTIVDSNLNDASQNSTHLRNDTDIRELTVNVTGTFINGSCITFFNGGKIGPGC